jgi:translocation and assembly module TamB
LSILTSRLEFVHGNITFAGDFGPELDFLARTQAGGATIEIAVTGQASDPQFAFTSSPDLPQDEVLSRVLFGREVARITPIQGIQLAAAVRQLQGGAGVDSVLGAIRRATGLDTLTVQGGTTPGEASASAGKYLSNNVYVQVQQGLQASSGQAKVEVQITPNLSVGTNVTGQSQTGVNLQWRYDY